MNTQPTVDTLKSEALRAAFHETPTAHVMSITVDVIGEINKTTDTQRKSDLIAHLFLFIKAHALVELFDARTRRLIRKSYNALDDIDKIRLGLLALLEEKDQ